MKDWLIRLLTSHGKAHNIVLMIVALSFAAACWRCADATVLASIGGTLAALYGVNGWAGTRSPSPAKPAVPEGAGG